MQNKILFCATVDYHFKAFHLPYMEWFKKQGWEVHVAASGDMVLPFVDAKYNIPISRSPFSKKNYQAFIQLKNLMNDNKYKIVHCHTPVGGALARIAAKKFRKNGTKIIYTAHGFHFCKGAPILNWIIYYPIEKLLALDTDCLITINDEDYKLAKQNHFKAGRIEHIHGVGVDTEKFIPADIEQKKFIRKSLGYSDNDLILFYAAEFNKNKNQQLLLKSLNLVKSKIPNLKLLLVGEGPLLDECKKLTYKLGLSENVDFLGYRNDIQVLLKIVDIAVASSLREGLPVNILEAMACGLPIIATENRGHKELVINNKNGWIINDEDVGLLSEKIEVLSDNFQLRKFMGKNGRDMILQRYSIQKIIEKKSTLYKLFMGEVEESI